MTNYIIVLTLVFSVMPDSHLQLNLVRSFLRANLGIHAVNLAAESLGSLGTLELETITKVLAKMNIAVR